MDAHARDVTMAAGSNEGTAVMPKGMDQQASQYTWLDSRTRVHRSTHHAKE